MPPLGRAGILTCVTVAPAVINGPSVARIEQATRLVRNPSEEMVACAWARVEPTRAEWGLGWWFFAQPINWLQRRSRLRALSRDLDFVLPRFAAISVTDRRVLFFRTDRLVVSTPRFVGALDRSAIVGVGRPTVGGYLRTMNLCVRPQKSGREVDIPLLVVGEPGDEVADALRPVTAPR